MAENLGCLLHGHVGCYCSCAQMERCCGCQQFRPNVTYHLHCLICETDFSSEVSKDGEFDQAKFEQGERLEQARRDSCRRLKRRSIV